MTSTERWFRVSHQKPKETPLLKMSNKKCTHSSLLPLITEQLAHIKTKYQLIVLARILFWGRIFFLNYFLFFIFHFKKIQKLKLKNWWPVWFETLNNHLGKKIINKKQKGPHPLFGKNRRSTGIIFIWPYLKSVIIHYFQFGNIIQACFTWNCISANHFQS